MPSAFFLPDHPAQAVDAGAAMRPTRGSGSAKTAVLGGNDDVAGGERGLEAAAHRHAIDRGDQRLVEVEAVREAGKPVTGRARAARPLAP